VDTVGLEEITLQKKVCYFYINVYFSPKLQLLAWFYRIIVPCDSQPWAIQCRWTTEYATRAGRFT